MRWTNDKVDARLKDCKMRLHCTFEFVKIRSHVEIKS